MPEILTYNTPDSIEKERIKQPFYRSFFDWFSSQDKFTKLYMITFALIILATPFIVNNYLEVRQRAAGVVRGIEGDGWADVVIGKPDFASISPNEVVASKLFNRHGVLIDRHTSPQKIYVWDSGNNRILAWNWDTLLASGLSGANPLVADADRVIGQPNYTSAGANGDSSLQNYGPDSTSLPDAPPATASSLCGLKATENSPAEGGSGASMAVDSSGNLYVFDACNKRVLKFNDPFGPNTDRNTVAVAADVWGQDNFTDNLPNKDRGLYSPDATSLSYCWGETNSWTAGVEVDSSGNLWVADNCNNRVLRFPPGSHTADLVLGQSGFTTNTYGPNLNQFQTPAALRFDSQTGYLFVADQGNNRVLRFKSPFTNGMNGEIFGSGFGNPEGVDLDPTEPGKIWVANKGHATLELWDQTTGTKVRELGRRGDGNVLGQITGSIGVDKDGNVVAGGGSMGGAVLYVKGAALDLPTKQVFSIFGKDAAQGNKLSPAGLGGQTTGVAVADNQMIVAGGGRLLYWNNPQSLVSGQPADGYASWPDRKFSSFNDYQSGWQPVIASDKNHHLWIGGAEVSYYNLPLQTGASPTKIPKTLNVLGGGQITLGYYMWGITTADDGSFIWVSDRYNNRVVRVRNPLTNPIVDVILGQKDVNGTQINQGGEATANTLNLPGSLALDRFGNLFVSDHSLEYHGNRRMLVFKTDLTPTGNPSLIAAPAASKIFPNIAPWQPAFDSQNRMFLGYNVWIAGNIGSPKHRYISVYNDPLGSSTAPDAFLNDFFSHPFSLTFDDWNNLYAADLNRNRVLIYKRPNNTQQVSPPPSASPSPIPTPTSSITITSTPTPVPITQPVSNTGNITGTVSSSTGGIVSGAKITVSVNGKNFTYTTNFLGVYTITSLNPGTYSLKFSAKGGYINQTVSATVTSNITTTANVTLAKR